MINGLNKVEKLAIFLFIALAVISLATQNYGSVDVGEYAGSAKYFAGKYQADLIATHSVMYGFIHAPLVYMFNSLIVMKITTLLSLFLIVLSLYYLSGKSKRILLLSVLAPIVWYMGPRIEPLPMASLLFLWAFFFMQKFNLENKYKYLIYSGILAGLSSALWNAAIYGTVFLAVCFLINKNINYSILFLGSLFFGLLPLMILEQWAFGFFFYSLAKTFSSNVLAIFSESIYSGVILRTSSISNYIAFFLVFPIFSFILFYSKNFRENKRAFAFLGLLFLFLFTNPQVRYLTFFVPLVLLYLPKYINREQFRIQIALFTIISLLVTTPYLIQIVFPMNSPDFESLVVNRDFGISDSSNKIILRDLEKINLMYPNQSFVVGPAVDDYNALALLYWGKSINEFVSIQDYEMYSKNESNLFSRRFETNLNIQGRRAIWIEGGMSVNPKDRTDFGLIQYALSFNENLGLDDFTPVMKLDKLYLFEKVRQN